jgi:hypothetical protein
VHYSDQVTEKGSSDQLPLLNTVKVSIAQESQLSCGSHSQPVLIQQPHQVPHTDHPLRLVNLTGSSQKDILPTLDILPRIEEGNPECLCHCFRPMLFIERIDPIPLKIRG